MDEDKSSLRYTFKGEWREVENCRVTEFLISYFVGDGTIELFDTKRHRLFLKRTASHQVTLKDLFIGNSVNIMSRQIVITDYGDNRTRQQMQIRMQKTVCIVKPDQLKNMGHILEAILENGFTFGNIQMVQLSRELAVEIYSTHPDVSQQTELVSHLISGPVLILQLLGDNAIERWHQFVGPSSLEEAKKNHPTSLIARFGQEEIKNGFHSSGDAQEVERILGLLFPFSSNLSLRDLKFTATVKNCSCCIIKPHAIQEGLCGKIVSAIQRGGFKITALRQIILDHSAAEEFLEVYYNVVPEYPAMVTQLCSGACIALEIVGRDENTPRQFREFVGPSDPEIARKIRPNSLRAQFGRNKILNAVHCTDLPDDAILEVEYFFRLL